MNEQFKEWLVSHINEGVPNKWEKGAAVDWFRGWKFSMQWGVYLSFFDSKDIRIIIGGQWWSGQWVFYVDGLEAHFEKGDNLTRTEAQKEAIKKAFEILNKQK